MSRGAQGLVNSNVSHFLSDLKVEDRSNFCLLLISIEKLITVLSFPTYLESVQPPGAMFYLR